MLGGQENTMKANLGQYHVQTEPMQVKVQQITFKPGSQWGKEKW